MLGKITDFCLLAQQPFAAEHGAAVSQGFDQGGFSGAVHTQQTDAVTRNDAQLDIAQYRSIITKLSIFQFQEVLWLYFRLHELEAKR